MADRQFHDPSTWPALRHGPRDGSYKPVGGVMYPFSIAQGSKSNPGSQMFTVEKMEVNVTIDPADFAVPASLKQAPKSAADKK